MRLLKLVIVDDEPILLQGLLNTYDWEDMGFEVAGFAQSGEQAIEVIKEVKPHVVLTDIRMKQITGLMVMEEIQKTDLECLFIVLSAYREFDYAQQACDLGAYAYLLKPIEDDKLKETMQGAYQTCMERMESEEKYESWEKLLVKDSDSFVQVVVQKYVQNRIPEEKVEEVFHTFGDMPGNEDRFITVYVDIDLAYKITNSLDYEASRFALMKKLEEVVGREFFCWRIEEEESGSAFIIRTQDKEAVRKLKQLLEHVKKDEKSPVVAAISKPYKKIDGIKRSYMEARRLFGVASISGASAFTASGGDGNTAGGRVRRGYGQHHCERSAQEQHKRIKRGFHPTHLQSPGQRGGAVQISAPRYAQGGIYAAGFLWADGGDSGQVPRILL